MVGWFSLVNLPVAHPPKTPACNLFCMVSTIKLALKRNDICPYMLGNYVYNEWMHRYVSYQIRCESFLRYWMTLSHIRHYGSFLIDWMTISLSLSVEPLTHRNEWVTPKSYGALSSPLDGGLISRAPKGDGGQSSLLTHSIYLFGGGADGRAPKGPLQFTYLPLK